jgi:4-amino-4-deoxy-L-arabinose transferase-like glycosyltransferase
MPKSEPTLHSTQGGLPPLGWLTVLLTGAMSAVWSAHKLLEQDEIFSLQTDRVSSLAEVFRIQRLYPISLEPPPYHVLAHAAMAIFGPTAFALRLPAFVGYLLMQVCLYFFVRNLVGNRSGDPIAQRAGLVAMAIPALTWTLYYSAEGRPYGLLLGSYGLAVLCWQVAARRDGESIRQRIWPLVGLAAALALTLNVHFYGVLLLAPLCGAELLRIWQRRRLDVGILGALAAGTATMAFSLPYVKSSGEFKKHYYAGPVSPHMLTQPYRQMLLNYTTFPHAVQTAMAGLLVLAAVAVAWGCLRVLRSGTLAATPPEYLMVLLLVLLPGFAFVLGKLVTHALEVRHSIGAVIGIVTLIALALAPVLRTSMR